jgi:primase-polymerase (primpol)-like protein
MLTNRDQIQPVDPDRIPQVLKDALQWTVWKAEPNAKKPGTLDKVPYRAKAPGRKASSIDASTWADYMSAYDAYVRRAETCADGLMFACGNGLGGVRTKIRMPVPETDFSV